VANFNVAMVYFTPVPFILWNTFASQFHWLWQFKFKSTVDSNIHSSILKYVQYYSKCMDLLRSILKEGTVEEEDII
jgi:hypothetical protein